MAVSFPVKAAAEIFANDEVIALSKAGVGDPALIAKIEGLPCAYDLAVPQLARLKKAGVSNVVIAALIRHCGASEKTAQVSAEALYANRQPGVYLVLQIAGYQALEMIVPALVASGQSHGNGSLLFPQRSRLTLPGNFAKVRSQTQSPSFVVVITPSIERQGFNSISNAIPEELLRYRLVRFSVKGSKRFLSVDSHSALGSYSGPDQGVFHPVRITKIDDRIFRIEVDGSISPGEYALIFERRTGIYEVFDFHVP